MSGVSQQFWLHCEHLRLLGRGNDTGFVLHKVQRLAETGASMTYVRAEILIFFTIPVLHL